MVNGIDVQLYSMWLSVRCRVARVARRHDLQMLQRSSESRPLFKRGLELTALVTLRAHGSVAPLERVLLLSCKRTHTLAFRTCVAWSQRFA